MESLYHRIRQEYLDSYKDVRIRNRVGISVFEEDVPPTEKEIMDHAFKIAIASNNIELVLYLLSIGGTVTEQLIDEAILHANLKMVELLYTRLNKDSKVRRENHFLHRTLTEIKRLQLNPHHFDAKHSNHLKQIFLYLIDSLIEFISNPVLQLVVEIDDLSLFQKLTEKFSIFDYITSLKYSMMNSIPGPSINILSFILSNRNLIRDIQELYNDPESEIMVDLQEGMIHLATHHHFRELHMAFKVFEWGQEFLEELNAIALRLDNTDLFSILHRGKLTTYSVFELKKLKETTRPGSAIYTRLHTLEQIKRRQEGASIESMPANKYDSGAIRNVKGFLNGIERYGKKSKLQRKRRRSKSKPKRFPK
jgi:hypothetical protein